MRQAITVADHGNGDGDDLQCGGGVEGERYKIWPLAKLPDGSYSVPDFVLLRIWDDIFADGRYKSLFYNGGVKTPFDWMAWIKSPANFPVLVVDTMQRKVVCIAWINNAVDGAAMAHFCMLGLPRVEIGKAVLQYWSGVDGLKVLVGFTPESNTGAVKYAKKIGFVESGYIPMMCNMVHEGRRVGAVVTTYLTHQEEG